MKERRETQRMSKQKRCVEERKIIDSNNEERGEMWKKRTEEEKMEDRLQE